MHTLWDIKQIHRYDNIRNGHEDQLVIASYMLKWEQQKCLNDMEQTPWWKDGWISNYVSVHAITHTNICLHQLWQRPERLPLTLHPPLVETPQLLGSPDGLVGLFRSSQSVEKMVGCSVGWARGWVRYHGRGQGGGDSGAWRLASHSSGTSWKWSRPVSEESYGMRTNHHLVKEERTREERGGWFKRKWGFWEVIRDA